MRRLLKKEYVGWVVVLVIFLAWRQFGPGLPADTVRSHERIAAAFANRQSGIMVEFDARVDRLLQDDLEGNPHQRFIVRLDNGHTLLIAHNIDLARRVPLDRRDLIRIRGEYEWNSQGGVVHWTHRDPGLGLKHGWIEHKGQVYE